MRSIAITGASRGIGLEFVRQFAALKPAPKHIFALCRTPSKATDLANLAQHSASNGCHIHLMEHDVTAYDKIDKLVEEIDKIVGADGLTLLVNNAGIGDAPDRLADLEPSVFLRNFETNTVGPAMLTKKLWPLLKRAAALKKDGTLKADKAAVMNISSLYGSIGDCTSGGCYSYRCSKTAMNMLTRCLSIDMRADEILVAAFSPGFVKTDMTQNQGRLEASESVGMMIDTLLKLDSTHSGQFVNYRCELQPF